MLNITGKYVTVFQPQINLNVSERMVFANLSTSKKNTSREGDISYENMSWKGRFVGDAFEPSKALRDGDKIDIVRGMITNKYDKEKKKLYVDVTIFEYALSDTNKNNEDSHFSNYGDMNGDNLAGGK